MHGWHQHISTWSSLKNSRETVFVSVSVWDGPPDTAKGRAVEIPPGVLTDGSGSSLGNHGKSENPSDHATTFWACDHKWGAPSSLDGFIMENPIKWMIWRYPYFRQKGKPPYVTSVTSPTPGTCKRLPLLEIAAQIEDNLNMVLCPSRYNTPTYTNETSFRRLSVLQISPQFSQDQLPASLSLAPGHRARCEVGTQRNLGVIKLGPVRYVCPMEMPVKCPCFWGI